MSKFIKYDNSAISEEKKLCGLSLMYNKRYYFVHVRQFCAKYHVIPLFFLVYKDEVEFLCGLA
jgi:hypothetical protein